MCYSVLLWHGAPVFEEVCVRLLMADAIRYAGLAVAAGGTGANFRINPLSFLDTTANCYLDKLVKHEDEPL